MCRWMNNISVFSFNALSVVDKRWMFFTPSKRGTVSCPVKYWTISLLSCEESCTSKFFPQPIPKGKKKIIENFHKLIPYGHIWDEFRWMSCLTFKGRSPQKFLIHSIAVKKKKKKTERGSEWTLSTEIEIFLSPSDPRNILTKSKCYKFSYSEVMCTCNTTSHALETKRGPLFGSPMFLLSSPVISLLEWHPSITTNHHPHNFFFPWDMATTSMSTLRTYQRNKP